jgi:hypothetical protein
VKVKEFILLLTMVMATATASAQSLRLDFSGTPLNRALNSLDLDLSFDNRALAAYSVTASKTFTNPEEALYWLLHDKPFAVEKIGNVFVIVPAEDDNPNGVENRTQNAVNERYRYCGNVIDSISRESLEYATVFLLYPDTQIITAGITNNNGRFEIETKTIPKRIKISYLGYKTLSAEITGMKEDLGEFCLTENAFELDEAVAIADKNPNRSIYEVTPQMCRGAANALELLNIIEDVRYDHIADEILVNQDNNTLIIVNGIQHSRHYLKHLAPNRVRTIEVIRASSGRFVSDDYSAIIQFVLRKDYTGLDISVSHRAVLNLTGHSFTENSPEMGIIYTANKFNFFGTGSYTREKTAMYSAKELTYSESDLVSFPESVPNDLSAHKSASIAGGVNYQISPRQQISAQVDYSSGNDSNNQVFTMHPLDKVQNISRIIVNTTEIGSKYKTVMGAISYKGQLNNRLQLYGDFTYNYYYNYIVNGYNQNDYRNYSVVNSYDEYKNHTVFNIESRYTVSPRLSLETGYSNILRMYGSESSQGRGFLDYLEHRNKGFIYLSFFHSGRFALKTGFAMENIKTGGNNAVNDYLRVLPCLQARFNFSDDASLMINYSTNQSYPMLYQLSPMNLVIDTFLTQIGNSSLKSALKHHIFSELTLWNRLKITPQFISINDGVSEVYEKKEWKLYRTFENIQTREYNIQASYNQPFGDYLRLKSDVLYYYDEAFHNEVHNSLIGWTLNSELNYYNPRLFIGASVGYHRNMRKNILWQGYQMQNRDCWRLSLRKEFLNDRISVALTYIPPFTPGVRYDRTKQMDTPLYREKTTVDMASQKQMLLLKCCIRFERGSVKRIDKQENIGKEERVW